MSWTHTPGLWGEERTPHQQPGPWATVLADRSTDRSTNRQPPGWRGLSNAQSCPAPPVAPCCHRGGVQPLSPVAGSGVPFQPGLPQCLWGPAWSIPLPHSFPSNASPSSGTQYSGASLGRDGELRIHVHQGTWIRSRGSPSLCPQRAQLGAWRRAIPSFMRAEPGLTQVCVPSISQHSVWPRKVLGKI